MIEKAFGTDCQALYAGIYCQACFKCAFNALLGRAGGLERTTPTSDQKFWVSDDCFLLGAEEDKKCLWWKYKRTTTVFLLIRCFMVKGMLWACLCCKMLLVFSFVFFFLFLFLPGENLRCLSDCRMEHHFPCKIVLTETWWDLTLDQISICAQISELWLVKITPDLHFHIFSSRSLSGFMPFFLDWQFSLWQIYCCSAVWTL